MNNLKELKKTEMVLIPVDGGKRKKHERTKVSAAEAAIRIIGIPAARAMPFAGTAPFGLAFLAMERRFSVQSLISLLMAAIGYISIGELSALRYIGACLMYMGFLFFVDKEELPLKTAAAAAAGMMALADAAAILWSGVSAEILITAVFDMTLTVLGVLVFDKVKLLIKDDGIITHMPSSEEKRSVCIIAGITILGFQGLPLFGGFSAANFLGYMLLGMAAISGGLLSGVIFALAVGVLLGLQGDLMSYTAVFGICGLTCGLAGRYGKYAAAAALALSGALLSLYAFGAGGEVIRIYEAPIAAAVLAFLPNRVFGAVKRFTDFGFEIVDADNPYKEYIRARLDMTADSFIKLSDTFMQLSDKKNSVDMQDIAFLFDTAADRVCKNCAMVKECWKRDFNATYKTMFKLLEIMEIKGGLEEADIETRFAARCLNLRQLIKELNRLFEIYKINRVWKNKLCENRELTAEQFKGVADILKQMSEEFESETSFDNMAADEIKCRLSDKGIQAAEVCAVMLHRHKTVRLTVRKNTDCGVIPGVLKSVLGGAFACACAPMEADGEYITLRYNEAPDMSIEAGISCSGKNEECGDSHILNSLRGGKFLATISDGMGTGHPASRESGAIVELLERFMDAGFDKTTAVKLINSVMVMKSAGDAFATVDMCMIDLYSGEAEFIKNGAEPSYIKRSVGTETVRAASLPVGVVSDVEIESFAHKLGYGDTIVMVSDGLEIKEGHEGWLRSTIAGANPDMPVQELADMLMAKSITLKGGEADDDMTVVVLRMCRHTGAESGVSCN